jgi:hypothetical protein
MATLDQLFNLRNSSTLRNKVAAAGWNEAKDIFLEAPSTAHHAERLIWAVEMLRDSGDGAKVEQVFRAVCVLLQDSGETSTDAQIQTAVGQVVNHFATAGV